MGQAAHEEPRAVDAFEAMFDAYLPAVLAYCRRRTAQFADAEDAAAETFTIAWRRFASMPDEPLPWLYGVARRVLANARRGRERRRRLGWRLWESSSHEAMSYPAGETSDSPALTALAQLSSDDRELIALVAWEELDHTQIAASLGISVNAVAIRLHRARRRFDDAYRRVTTGDVKGFDTSGTSREAKGLAPGATWQQEDDR